MEVIQQTFPNESSAEKTISKEFKGSYSEETKMIGAVDDIYHPLPEENPKYEQMEEETRCARKKLCTACICCIVFMVVEVIAGFLSNSLALLTDASHLLSDVCSFSISIFAIWVSRIQGNSKMSFGYHRAEILGALISIILIWVLTGWLVYAAIGRLQSRIIVEGNIMFVTAIFEVYSSEELPLGDQENGA
ncbi:hypothetical protein IE077_002854 [Cardiosporidium cionae]|uniref:Cation efflux protein transmembrane domain-containing protein n=1 Tax=Cardiosporidium cionae TaxID=476202 RepID=A0ABQ7J9R6_9APIC|nr:hypothetical protein IE077_002854 [Cardiosporidium cionae]|eukprot:KAF8820736.1 hypothetical protein IE077_002854 [Cardiosporidium cionae]